MPKSEETLRIWTTVSMHNIGGADTFARALINRRLKLFLPQRMKRLCDNIALSESGKGKTSRMGNFNFGGPVQDGPREMGITKLKSGSKECFLKTYQQFI